MAPSIEARSHDQGVLNLV